MALLANLIFFLAIPAALAAGAAFALANLAPRWSLRARSAIAALLAGGLPVAVPIAALVSTSGYEGDLAIPLVTLIVVGLIVAIVIGLPVALAVGRRSAANQVDASREG